MIRCFKLLPVLLLLLCFAESSFAQGALATFNVWRYTPAGIFAASTATVTICTSSGAGTPCTPTLTIYKDVTLLNPVANPLAACPLPAPQFGCIDGLGNVSFYMTPGPFTYTVTGAGLTAYGPIPAGTSCFVGVTCPATSSPNTWTALQAFNSGLTFSTITSQTANPSSQGAVRLANGDSLFWSNSAHTPGCELDLSINGTNTFSFGGGCGVGGVNSGGIISSSTIGASSYFYGPTANSAASGLYRLANTDHVSWRDAGNATDHLLGEVQHVRAAGCATGAAQFNTCDTTMFWPSAFADANYTVSCVGDVVTSGVPTIQAINVSAPKAAGSSTARTIALTAAVAQFSAIDCVGIHD